MKSSYYILSSVIMLLCGVSLFTAKQAISLENPTTNQETAKLKPGKAWLGIVTSELSPALRTQLNLKPSQGVVVDFFVPNSPSKEELRVYDIILSIDNREIGSRQSLQQFLYNKFPGDKVTLNLLRQGERITSTITLGERPTPLQSGAVQLNIGNSFEQSFNNLDEELMRYLRKMFNSQVPNSLLPSQQELNHQGGHAQVKTYGNFSMTNIQRSGKYTASLSINSADGWHFKVTENTNCHLVYECKAKEEIVVEVIPSEFQDLYKTLLNRSKNNSSFNIRFLESEDIQKEVQRHLQNMKSDLKKMFPKISPNEENSSDIPQEIEDNQEPDIEEITRDLKVEILNGKDGEIKVFPSPQVEENKEK